MLALYLCRQDGHVQRLVVDGPSITLGSGPTCTVRVADLPPLACELTLLRAGVTLADPAGAGARVGGATVAEATPIYADETVYIGTYSFRFERLEHAPDPHEEALLAAIRDGDVVSRDVYADWLEEHGDLRRADFLRLQELVFARPETFPEHRARLRELARATDLAWRARISRARFSCEIARRNLGTEPCDGLWSSLGETDLPEVRVCDMCRTRFVYVVDAKQRVASHERPVLDYAAIALPEDPDPAETAEMVLEWIPGRRCGPDVTD